MVNLVAQTPCAGLLPLSHGDIQLTEITPDAVFSVAPFAGKNKAVSDALKKQLGGVLSAVNRQNDASSWFGHGVWRVYSAVNLDGLAAVSDQSDAWATVEISGDSAEDVLARLVPIDLRASVFKKNHVAKTMLAHMSVTIVRTGPKSFEITAFRSMAKTLVHDLERSMKGVAARQG